MDLGDGGWRPSAGPSIRSAPSALCGVQCTETMASIGACPPLSISVVVIVCGAAIAPEHLGMAGEAGMDTGCRRAWPQMLSTALTLVWVPGIPRSTLPRYGVIDPAPLPGLTPSAPLWCHYETSGFRGMERTGWACGQRPPLRPATCYYGVLTGVRRCGRIFDLLHMHVCTTWQQKKCGACSM